MSWRHLTDLLTLRQVIILPSHIVRYVCYSISLLQVMNTYDSLSATKPRQQNYCPTRQSWPLRGPCSLGLVLPLLCLQCSLSSDLIKVQTDPLGSPLPCRGLSFLSLPAAAPSAPQVPATGNKLRSGKSISPLHTTSVSSPSPQNVVSPFVSLIFSGFLHIPSWDRDPVTVLCAASQYCQLFESKDPLCLHGDPCMRPMDELAPFCNPHEPSMEVP